MKIIDKVGIEKILLDMRRRGEKLRFSSPKKDAAAVEASKVVMADGLVEMGESV